MITSALGADDLGHDDPEVLTPCARRSIAARARPTTELEYEAEETERRYINEMVRMVNTERKPHVGISLARGVKGATSSSSLRCYQGHAIAVVKSRFRGATVGLPIVRG